MRLNHRKTDMSSHGIGIGKNLKAKRWPDVITPDECERRFYMGDDKLCAVYNNYIVYPVGAVVLNDWGEQQGIGLDTDQYVLVSISVAFHRNWIALITEGKKGPIRFETPSPSKWNVYTRFILKVLILFIFLLILYFGRGLLLSFIHNHFGFFILAVFVVSFLISIIIELLLKSWFP